MEEQNTPQEADGTLTIGSAIDSNLTCDYYHIFPVRYALRAPEPQPGGGAKGEPEPFNPEVKKGKKHFQPKLELFRITLRKLREGYLHIYAPGKWQCTYRINRNGDLSLNGKPESWVKIPKDISMAYMAYSPVEWSKTIWQTVRAEYQQRMQAVVMHEASPYVYPLEDLPNLVEEYRQKPHRLYSLPFFHGCQSVFQGDEELWGFDLTSGDKNSPEDRVAYDWQKSGARFFWKPQEAQTLITEMTKACLQDQPFMVVLNDPIGMAQDFASVNKWNLMEVGTFEAWNAYPLFMALKGLDYLKDNESASERKNVYRDPEKIRQFTREYEAKTKIINEAIKIFTADWKTILEKPVDSRSNSLNCIFTRDCAFRHGAEKVAAQDGEIEFGNCISQIACHPYGRKVAAELFLQPTESHKTLRQLVCPSKRRKVPVQEFPTVEWKATDGTEQILSALSDALISEYNKSQEARHLLTGIRKRIELALDQDQKKITATGFTGLQLLELALSISDKLDVPLSVTEEGKAQLEREGRAELFEMIASDLGAAIDVGEKLSEEHKFILKFFPKEDSPVFKILLAFKLTLGTICFFNAMDKCLKDPSKANAYHFFALCCGTSVAKRLGEQIEKTVENRMTKLLAFSATSQVGKVAKGAASCVAKGILPALVAYFTLMATWEEAEELRAAGEDTAADALLLSGFGALMLLGPGGWIIMFAGFCLVVAGQILKQMYSKDRYEQWLSSGLWGHRYPSHAALPGTSVASLRYKKKNEDNFSFFLRDERVVDEFAQMQRNFMMWLAPPTFRYYYDWPWLYLCVASPHFERTNTKVSFHVERHLPDHVRERLQNEANGRYHQELNQKIEDLKKHNRLDYPQLRDRAEKLLQDRRNELLHEIMTDIDWNDRKILRIPCEINFVEGMACWERLYNLESLKEQIMGCKNYAISISATFSFSDDTSFDLPLPRLKKRLDATCDYIKLLQLQSVHFDMTHTENLESLGVDQRSYYIKNGKRSHIIDFNFPAVETNSLRWGLNRREALVKKHGLNKDHT